MLCFIGSLMSCACSCSVTLLYGAERWSVVCDCGIPYFLANIQASPLRECFVTGSAYMQLWLGARHGILL